MAVCRETTLQPLILLILQRRIEPRSGRESFQHRYTIMLEVSRNHYNDLTSVYFEALSVDSQFANNKNDNDVTFNILWLFVLCVDCKLRFLGDFCC